MTGDPEPISAQARRALEQELADLQAERRLVAGTLRDLSVGDQADQADELRRADQLGRLDRRIEDITERLSQAEAAGPAPTDVVGVGSTVTVRFSDGATEALQIGEVAEALDQALVTADSPLGRALLGRRPGDTVHYNTPDGPATAVVVSIGE
ncbi:MULTISPECIES: GreA/GreB family elongation factor [Streptomyces]|uniref:GreA/GreB family elongation factor n=1 Tax=Streptomyces TaxID=1883 RepID=UPI0016707AE3|nr:MULTISPECIES: GreA/GreB family elongation factor [Streptomyces]UFR06608.1 GreA/GreB family elongation factor [Streptomyces sp. Go40/10]GGS53675.1 transcription elongation factor GreA [Streptomyces cinerochromogenes]